MRDANHSPAPSAFRTAAWRRAAHLLGLVLAGEAVFSLPFHVTRFFRPSVLLAFDLTNTDLGAAQAVYGVTAMLAYFPGGLLADRFEARNLLATSLLATAAGGLWFVRIQSPEELGVLFGFWGASTILLFWGALISATREWGGAREQGRGFGILDGGRGLLAAVLASAGAALFGTFLPGDGAAVDPEARRQGLRAVIHAYAIVTAVTGALVWWLVPVSGSPRDPPRDVEDAPGRLRLVLSHPAVWLQAIIVVSAYVAYKGFDQISLYAHDAWGFSEGEAANFASAVQWIRPVAAVGAGLVADRVSPSRVVMVGFAALLLSDLVLATTGLPSSALWFLIGNVIVTCVAMFGLRGIYFALLEEARIPRAATGTAVGWVSVIGYTPDVFVALVAGVLIDRAPGATGHQHFYWFLSGFAALGLVASALFRKVVATRR